MFCCPIFKSFVCSKILIDYGGIDWGIKNAFKEIKLLLLSLSGSVSLLARKCMYCILYEQEFFLNYSDVYNFLCYKLKLPPLWMYKAWLSNFNSTDESWVKLFQKVQLSLWNHHSGKFGNKLPFKLAWKLKTQTFRWMMTLFIICN